MEVFPVASVPTLLQRATTHKAFVDKSKTISDTATPAQFTSSVKWVDWVPTFINFLRSIPGRNGVPLSYVCRPDNVIIQPNYADFLDEYIDKAPLHGSAFMSDTIEVHIYLNKFVSDNDVAESKLQALTTFNNGRRDFLALRDHYEGIGVNALDVTKADRLLDTLFYSGEKRPHMWWDEFERLLNEAFSIYNKREGRQVHSEHMKLRILCRKVQADFLQNAKAAIQLDLARVPMTLTYDAALASFRNQVNLKFPPEMSAANNRNRTRRIQQTSIRGEGRSSSRGGGRNGRNGGRSSGRFQGRGRSTHRHVNQSRRRNRSDARMVRCLNGSNMEIHPAYKFSDDEWNLLPESERNRIIEERQSYKRSRLNNNNYHQSSGSVISEITTGTPDLQSIANSVNQMSRHINELQNHNNNNNNLPPSSIMGGRNEQRELRSRNNHNNN